MKYTAYGLTLESEIALHGLCATDGAPVLRILRGRRLPDVAVNQAGPAADDDVWLRLTRDGPSLVLEFDGGGVFTFSPVDQSIAVHLDGRGLTDTAHHLLLDQVLPLVLSHAGRLVLHASALNVGGRGVAFVGPGGAGKSTLAASFARHGGTVLADDALAIELSGSGVAVQPAYPGVRVWPDVLSALEADGSAPSVGGYSEKRRLGVPHGMRFATSSVPLDRVYFVQAGASCEPRVGSIPNRDAVIALLTHSFVLDPSDMTRLSKQLEQACRVLERTAVRTLIVPRALNRLGDVRRVICRDLG